MLRNTIQICLATAHPAKFEEAVIQSLADHPHFDFSRDVLPSELKRLLELPQRFSTFESDDPEKLQSMLENAISLQ